MCARARVGVCEGRGPGGVDPRTPPRPAPTRPRSAAAAAAADAADAAAAQNLQSPPRPPRSRLRPSPPHARTPSCGCLGGAQTREKRGWGGRERGERVEHNRHGVGWVGVRGGRGDSGGGGGGGTAAPQRCGGGGRRRPTHGAAPRPARRRTRERSPIDDLDVKETGNRVWGGQCCDESRPARRQTRNGQ